MKTIGANLSLSYSEPEIRYLRTQRLARIATVSREGRPDVVPVAFEFDGKYFYVGSHSQDIFHRTRKYKNVRDGNKWVALTVDDLESVDPWRPRGIKVYGTAEVVEHKGMFGPGKYLRITPNVSWGWGIKGLEAKEGSFRAKTVHRQYSVHQGSTITPMFAETGGPSRFSSCWRRVQIGILNQYGQPQQTTLRYGVTKDKAVERHITADVRPARSLSFSSSVFPGP